MLIKNMTADRPVTPSATQVVGAHATRSLDVLLGAALTLLTVGTVFTFSGLHADVQDPPLFLTDWLSGFAPTALAFVSGVVVCLRQGREGDMRATRRFLVMRGLFLIILQLTWLRTAWTFNFNYYDYELAGLMWMLGWSLLTLAACIRLAPLAIGSLGLLMLAVHQAIVLLVYAFPRSVYRILYVGGRVDLGPFSLEVYYSLIPWVGVILVGYFFGTVMRLPDARRRKYCFRIGLGITLAFLIISIIRASLSETQDIPLVLAMLAQKATPPSQLFLMMTIGPLIALIPVAEELSGAISEFFATLGSVPFFYYVIQLPLAHALACAVSWARTGKVDQWLFGNHPAEPPAVPAGYSWDLWQVYAVAVVVIALTYPAARIYRKRKAENPSSWMTYL